jgi:hypothetical protein
LADVALDGEGGKEFAPSAKLGDFRFRALARMRNRAQFIESGADLLKLAAQGGKLAQMLGMHLAHFVAHFGEQRAHAVGVHEHGAAGHADTP